MHRRQQAIDAAAHTLAHESAERPHVRRSSLRQNGCWECARHQDAIADHEPAGLVETPVGGNEVGPGQAIAVKENAKRAFARANAAVATLAAREKTRGPRG